MDKFSVSFAQLSGLMTSLYKVVIGDPSAAKQQYYTVKQYLKNLN